MIAVLPFAVDPFELEREPTNSEWSADVRLAVHSGLKSDMHHR
jgi:hypothetical protein